MSLTASTMMDLGTSAPSFSLPDVRTGELVSPAASGKPLLIMFICCHCPFVVHVRDELAHLGHDYSSKVDIIAISSNDVATHPADSPDNLKLMGDELGFTFSLCYDESQEVAKRYTAACTPDFFLFDAQHRLTYRGQLDGSRPSNDVAVDGRDLRAALAAVLAGKPVSATQYPSIGCNIKWKEKPAYYAGALVKK
jgi:peroxiredoxin